MHIDPTSPRPPAQPASAGPKTPAGASLRRGVSIQDVAAEAEVSTATVSRVLNNPELVSADTATRVRAAIDKLGYKPNLFAKGLMTRKSHVLAFALPDIHGEFYSELLRGADERARELGYLLLVSSEARRRSAPASSADHEADAAYQDLSFGIVDGIALLLTEPDGDVLARARTSGRPIVVMDQHVDEPGVDCITIDNTSGATEATRVLLGAGGRASAERLFFVGGPATNFDTRTRADAFTAELRATGHTPRHDQVAFKEYTEAWGYAWADRAIRQGLLKSTPAGAGGVLCADDEIAMGVLHAAHDHGLQLPRDLRLIGFDDTRLASLVRPKLSSVRVPMAQVGAEAVRLLVRRIEQPDAPADVLRLPTTLVRRETSGG
jgi:LacI family transcriptional regulator